MNWRSLLPRISGHPDRLSTPESGATALNAAEIRAVLAAMPTEERVPDWRPEDRIAGLDASGGRILLALVAPPAAAEALEPFRAAIEAKLAALPGVTAAQVILTAEHEPEAAPPPPPPQQPSLGRHPQGGKIELPDIARIIAVASGKGGVGKSTTSANLAMALAERGLAVGLLDADIYGPSVPRLFGCEGEKPLVDADGKMMPVERYGIRLMSIGFLLPPDAPVIWRGPMVAGAIEQLFRDVAWGKLDVLVIDLPPGTGDAQLTMAQKAPLTGAVIVSTPQDLALIDARRALAMFRKVDVPVHGIVENMSYYECPNCGHREHIFAHGGAAATAREMDVPFLGEIPLTLAIREASDAGTPIVKAAPDGPQAQAYRAIADAVMKATAA